LLGEPRRTLRTVRDPADPSHAPKVFDTRLTSDSLGCLLRIGYLNGEQVTHMYDASGSLATVTGSGAGYTVTYADELRYDVFGNCTRTAMAWSPRGASPATRPPGDARHDAADAGGDQVQALDLIDDVFENPVAAWAVTVGAAVGASRSRARLLPRQRQRRSPSPIAARLHQRRLAVGVAATLRSGFRFHTNR
jgi:hypothetical protein